MCVLAGENWAAEHLAGVQYWIGLGQVSSVSQIPNLKDIVSYSCDFFGTSKPEPFQNIEHFLYN